jgi:hypothetical protein
MAAKRVLFQRPAYAKLRIPAARTQCDVESLNPDRTREDP